MSRLVVGACSSCGRELRAKAHGIREEMHLTCSCGVSQRVTPTPDARRAAAEALDTPALRVPREIRAIVRDTDAQRAIATAFALVHDLGEGARHRLIATLKNVLSGTETGDSSTAALVLGDLGGSEAIDGLSRALDHWNPVVRTHAAARCSRMGEAGERALTNQANGRRDVVWSSDTARGFREPTAAAAADSAAAGRSGSYARVELAVLHRHDHGTVERPAIRRVRGAGVLWPVRLHDGKVTSPRETGSFLPFSLRCGPHRRSGRLWSLAPCSRP